MIRKHLFYTFFTICFLGFMSSCGSSTKSKSEGTTDTGGSKPKSPRQEVKGTLGEAHVLIRWGAPSVRGRQIWGELVPYDNIWRTGADTSTYMITDAPLKIGENTLPAGKYSIFTLPTRNEWTLILNSTWIQWGSFEYDESTDVLRVNVVPEDLSESTEMLTFFIESDGFGYVWEKKKVKVPVN